MASPLTTGPIQGPDVYVTTRRTITALGIDPGLASTGIGCVDRTADGQYVSRGVRLSRTEPARGKQFTRARTSEDDQRRVREHWNAVQSAIETIRPSVVGIENYTVYEPREVTETRKIVQDLLGLLPAGTPTELTSACIAHADRFHRLVEDLRSLAGGGRGGIGLGQAAKTVMVFGAALAAAYAAGVPVFVFQPADLKVRFGGRRGASKEDVGRGAEGVVQGLADVVRQKVPQKTLQEHVWDASAHAVLAADEYHRLRLDVS